MAPSDRRPPWAVAGPHDWSSAGTKAFLMARLSNSVRTHPFVHAPSYRLEARGFPKVFAVLHVKATVGQGLFNGAHGSPEALPRLGLSLAGRRV
eukprot:gene29160-32380_t